MPHFRIQIRERHKLLILFFLGALGSACFIRYAGIGMEEEICAKGRMIFAGLAADLAEGDGLFWRCMARRGLLPIVWTGLSFTVFGLASLYLFWIYLGFSMTTALWVAMVFGGWRGPFYFWGLLFPQYLLYAPALLLIYASCLQWNRFWRIRRAPIRRLPVRSPQLRRFLARNLLGLLLIAAGAYAESQWNPWLLKKIFIKM